jgi:hypothetical protein
MVANLMLVVRNMNRLALCGMYLLSAATTLLTRASSALMRIYHHLLHYFAPRRHDAGDGNDAAPASCTTCMACVAPGVLHVQNRGDDVAVEAWTDERSMSMTTGTAWYQKP